MIEFGGQISLDFRSDEPIYIQIVEQLRRMINAGDLGPGDQLPTVRQMATELRVNFNTVARAYRILDEAGVISTQRGRGTYIWEKPTEETMKQLKKKSLEELTRSYRDEVIRLGYNIDDAVEELKRFQQTGPQTDRKNQTEIEDKE